MKTYKVRLTPESLTFSAVHFIVFADGTAEAMHGHDFRVALEVEAALDAAGMYVIDFLRLERAVRDVLRELNHKVLLPGESRAFQMTVQQKEPEHQADLHGWVSTVGKWLTEVNDYHGEPGLPEMPEVLSQEEEFHAADDGVLRAEVEIRHQNRRWVFPEEDCVILPLENTTAELLADYILQKILKHPVLAEKSPVSMRVELQEAPGMVAVCEY